MKFVPVPGTEVKFSIWLTRNQDFQDFAKEANLKWDPGRWNEPDRPVVSITWSQAKAFCHWLTKKERESGTIPQNGEYRLPTDWEWSKAVGWDDDIRKTSQEREAKPCNEYPWGKQWPPPKGVANLAPNLGVDDESGTCPVGKFPPNHLGLYDMAGNATQWCEDFYDGKAGDKVSRGSGFPAHNSSQTLSSRRKPAPPDQPNVRIGFRCVLASANAGSPAPVAVVPAPVAPVAPVPVPPAAPIMTAPPAGTTPLKLLSQEGPNAIEWAVAPLDQAVPAGIRQNLKLLREELLDEAKAKPAATPEAYALARQLCDGLVSVLDERDATLVKVGYRAAQADANTAVDTRPMEVRRNHTNWPQYAREKDLAAESFRQQMNRSALTKELPKVEWSNRTGALRKSFDALYSKYREALRQEMK